MNKLNYINDIEKMLNNLGMNGKMIADKLRKCEKYESVGLEPEQIKSFLKDFGISVVMRNTKLMNELKEYKDLEEQGLLIKLPCKVGDVVYLLGGKDYNKFRVGCVDWKSGMEYKGKNYQLYMEDNYYDKAYRNFSDIGKTVFLTREEAEKALEEMNENK